MQTERYYREKFYSFKQGVYTTTVMYVFCQQLIPFVDSHICFNIYFVNYWLGERMEKETKKKR